ncbi:MAG TPA: hypothetical protein VNU01_08590 [Egibacteraceae bacterium]|nr:hypothetical protein [Egibacteraceae bacterium]
MRIALLTVTLALAAACAGPDGAEVSFSTPPDDARTQAVPPEPAATREAATPGAATASAVPAQTPGPAAPRTVPASPTPSGGPRELGADEDAKVGQPYLYRLYTHCGIEATWWNGAWWDADPPLSDGSGNPPPGWGNPYQDGVIVQVSETRLEFTGDEGQRAAFRPRPADVGAPPPCD